MQQDQNLFTLAERLRKAEDLAVLWSVPLLLLGLVIWAIGAAFSFVPLIGTVANLIVTIFTVIITFVLLLRLVDVLRGFLAKMSEPGEDEAAIFFVGTGLLCIVLIGLLLATIANAGRASTQRDILLAGLFLLLAWQYRRILVRVRKLTQENGD